MIKVLEIITDTNIGGAGVLLCSRLKYSDRKKFKYAVLLPRGSALTERLMRIPIQVIEFESKGDRSFEVISIFKCLKIIKNYSPDIVNAHGALSARIAALLTGVKVRIFTRHCAFKVGNIFKAPVARSVIGGVNAFVSPHSIAVARAAEENLIEMGYPKRRITVIINGVEKIRKASEQEKNELRKSLGIGEDDAVICISARLVDCKDHKTFLRAAKILCEKDRKFKFLIIGDGELRNPLEEYAKRLKIRKNVIFTGFVSDISPYLHISDIQVNCSIGTETSSLALSEGMSIGLPSVVSNFGGNPNMVKNGINGYVYKQGDARELACRIQQLIEHGDIYSKMSLEAKKRFCNEFNIQKTVKETEELYYALYERK